MGKFGKAEKHTIRWRPEVWDRMERLAGKNHIAEFANNAAWVFQRDELENVKERKKALVREIEALKAKFKILDEWENAAIKAKEKKAE